MKKITLLVLLLGSYNLLIARGFEAERQEVQNQFIDYNCSLAPADSLTEQYLQDMREDGTWEYVDYNSTRRGDWPTTDHLVYLDEMARSYAHPASHFYKDKVLKRSILRGVQHWLDAGYTNSNWYPIQVRAPKHILHIFLYLKDEIPEPMKEQAWQKMFKGLHMNRTGSNNVIAAENEIMKALIYDKEEIMDRAVEVIWAEVSQTTDEGIQADWCFHQHGHQQQLGNYGLSYSGRVSLWAYLLRQTSYELPKDKLAIHRHFLLNGPSWFLWKDKMDINASGRQYKINDLEIKYNAFMEQLLLMEEIDPAYKKVYRQRLEKPYLLTGHRSYWRTDFCVHRAKDWMASLSMSSARVVGTELCNMENFSGVHIGDGRLLLTQTGDEYHHIAPLWDWHRLPGTTCDQQLDTLIPQRSTRSKSEYAGVLDNGEYGIAAMHYQRKELKAKKSWFFTADAIVCLGADIDGHSSGPVWTSVEQSNLKGAINSSEGLILSKQKELKAGAWVHHNQTAYHLLDQSTVKTEYVKDNWQKCFPTYDDIAAEGGVFSLYIKHGQDPHKASYAYTIYPSVALSKVEKAIAKAKIQVVSNTAQVQAIMYKKLLFAVFYSAGELRLDAGALLKVDAPCLIMIDRQEIRVTDPVHQAQSIGIEYKGQAYDVDMPQGAQQGNCAVVLQ